MRILVTGGAGFIGSHVAERLLADGHEVEVIDDLSSGSITNLPSGAPLHELDLSLDDAVEAIRQRRPECVVHAAAQPSVAASFADPARDARSNILGTVNLILGALAGGAGRFVHLTSGGAIYGEPESLPADEEHPIRPISPYGLSKWTSERYFNLLVADPAQRVVMRLANIYGPRQRAQGEGGVIATFAERMLHRERVEIHGDGGQTRDFTFVADVADAVARALEIGASTTVNIGTGVATSINELYAEMAALTSYVQEPLHVPPRPGDVRNSVLAVSRAERVLGWRASTALADGLRTTLVWVAGSGQDASNRSR